MSEKHHPTPSERNERVRVPLDPAEFIEGALAVDPEDEDDEATEGESGTPE